LRRLLPHFNHSADVYLLSEDLEADWTSLTTVLDEASTFLRDWGFCRLNIRPVHPVRAGDGDRLRERYGALLGWGRGFHREALEHQVVSRWMVMPVLRIRSPEAWQDALGLARFLRERMMIPSFSFPPSPRASRWARSLDTNRERILCEGAGGALEALHGHDLFDDLLQWALSSSGGFSLEPCPSLVVDVVAGQARRCPHGPSMPLGEPVTLPGEGPAEGCLTCWDALPGRIRRALIWNGREEEGARVSHQLGLFALSRGELARARGHLLGASRRAKAPELQGESLLYLGILHLEEGDVERAHAALLEARELLPRAGSVRYHLGRCQFLWRDYIAASELFREARELGAPRELEGELAVYLGISHVQLGEFSEALAALEGWEGAGPTARFYRGMALSGLGRLEEALGELRLALAQGPDPEDLAPVHFYIGHCLKELERWEEALSPLRESIQADPGGYDAWNLLGYCLFRLQDHRGAIGAFLKALEINPRSAVDYANVGSNLRDLGDRQEAVKWYRRALKLDPTLGWVVESLRRIEEESSSGRSEGSGRRGGSGEGTRATR
jgi:tetratricopeptide (TPR) repeat protein